MIYTGDLKLLKPGSASTVRRAFGLSADSKVVSLLLLFVLFSSACGSSPTNAKGEESSEKTNLKAAENRAALLQAEASIERHRKGRARIKIIDKNGESIKSARLSVKQISHDFKFGCYLKIDDLDPKKLPAYENHFARLFNYAVVGTYWDFVENERGKPNWTWFEREVALARKLNLKIQGAPVLWGTNRAGTPAWLPAERAALLPILREQVETALTKNDGDFIDDWEIVNEPLAPKPDVFARRVGRDYVEAAFSWAREIAPAKRLMINEYGVFGSERSHNYARDGYFDLLKSLLEKGTSIDVVGIQAHASGEWYEPAGVAEQLERYASLGKPIQITEFSAQTLDYDDRRTPIKISGDYKTGVWDAGKQADFYREFYTIAFGNPQVEAIVQWGLDDERAWLPGIGLLDENGKPKPSYTELDRLINNEWRTNLQIESSGGEDFSELRGFYGTYEVEGFIDGKRSPKTIFELKKDAPNEWILYV